jgi:hypothetical protein
LETRAGEQTGYTGAKPAAGQVLSLQLTGRGGLPNSGVSAVVLNVTATQTDSGGYLTVWPSGQPQPFASSLNYERAGETIPNHVLVPVGTDGKVLLYTSAGTHLIADVAGYFTDDSAPAATGGLFVPVQPTRMIDTRNVDERGVPLGPVPPNDTRSIDFAGYGPIPSNDTAAVVANFTATRTAGPGYATVWPADTAQPRASNLNYEFAGQTRPNLVSVPAPGTGVNFFTNTATDLIADVFGYYTSQ